ncbi:MAG: glycosyltransferase family 4 protein [Minisyncoccia bacterium]
MKILVIHNRYLERGGEDEVVDSEIKLLKQFGHSVIFYESLNKEIESLSLFNKIRYLIKGIVWSEKSYKDIKSLLKKDRPDIAHVHNIFYSISPSVYYALKEEGIPVVQTLHNYRLICPNALLYINGKVCEKCLRGNFMFSLFYKCWRDSFFLTFFLARMLSFHSKKKTFTDKIDCFIALSKFSKNKYIEGGFPQERIFLKPNFIGLSSGKRVNSKEYILFVGRLVDYKGIDTLIAACKNLNNFDFKIIGDGPMYSDVKEKLKNEAHIELLGRLPHVKTMEFIKNAAFLIYSSECYENMPRIIIESFAHGVPVLASNRGAAKELVEDGVTGMLFEQKNSDDLANKIKFLMENRDLLIKLGENAYKEYQDKYTPEKNYIMLMEIYKNTLNKKFPINN